jgi:hypothetical protein
MATTRRPTNAARRRARAEAARQAAREAEARAQRRARNVRIGLVAAGVVVVLAVVAIVIAVNRSGGQPAAAATTAPGTTTAPATTGAAAAANTGNPPWAAPTDASAAVAAAGLPMLGQEGTATHTHTHLDIIVNGSPVQVPAEIGIDQAKQQISPLHTHDTSGVIHVESPQAGATFTLGQFFAEWRVPISADHVGGLTNDATHHLKAYVNGKLQTGDPAAIKLGAHDEIGLVYGGDGQQVNVPSSYQWTNGL